MSLYSRGVRVGLPPKRKTLEEEYEDTQRLYREAEQEAKKAGEGFKKAAETYKRAEHDWILIPVILGAAFLLDVARGKRR